MKRYNHDGVPMPMVEDKDGYWITYEDYNQSVLDSNKLVEKSWRARDSLSVVSDQKIEKLQNIIVGLSIGLWVAVVALLFSWM
jgi:tetrahydromethanopterin S-methyltransferase subunit B